MIGQLHYEPVSLSWIAAVLSNKNLVDKYFLSDLSLLVTKDLRNSNKFEPLPQQGRSRYNISSAVVAQLVEQLIRNEQVAGSIPVNGSRSQCGYSSVVGRDLPKVEARVQFSLPAPHEV